MDDLDRQIEEAARLAHAKIRRARLATVASTATFLAVAAGGTFIVLLLFPQPKVTDFDRHRQAMATRNEEPGPLMVAGDFFADMKDRNRLQLKLYPVIGVALAAALVVSKRLRPRA